MIDRPRSFPMAVLGNTFAFGWSVQSLLSASEKSPNSKRYCETLFTNAIYKWDISAVWKRSKRHLRRHRSIGISLREIFRSAETSHRKSWLESFRLVLDMEKKGNGKCGNKSNLLIECYINSCRVYFWNSFYSLLQVIQPQISFEIVSMQMMGWTSQVVRQCVHVFEFFTCDVC